MHRTTRLASREILTAGETLDFLRERGVPLGRTMLYRHLRSGAIPSMQIGKESRYLVSRHALELWLSRGTRGGQ